MQRMRQERDREATENKILNALGDLIKKEGFEKIGINKISQEAGVSKVLIYRYFGSVDELIIKYILLSDYWVNISVKLPEKEDLGIFLKELFRKQIQQFRENIVLKRMHRWELSVSNPSLDELRAKREQNACDLIEFVSRLTQSSSKEIASLATLVSASISYLVMIEEHIPIYNGINLQTEEGWEQIAYGIDLIVNLWIKNGSVL